MNEPLQEETPKPHKKLIHFSSDFSSNKKKDKTINLIRKLYEYKTEEREKIKKILNDYKEEEKSNYFLSKKNISFGRIKAFSPKSFYDKNNNLIPYSFVGPASLYQVTNSRRHTIRNFVKKTNQDKSPAIFSRSDKKLIKESGKEETKEGKNINFKFIDNKGLHNYYENIRKRISIKKNKNKELIKKIPNALRKSLNKQENVFLNSCKYSKFIEKLGEKMKNKTKKKTFDELLINENTFMDKKQELNIIEKNLTDSNKYTKNFWTITLRNSSKNGEYENDGYINTGTKYQPLYSVFKMNNNIEYIRNPHSKEDKKRKINNSTKILKTPKIKKAFSKFIYLSKIKQNLRNFDSIKTLEIKGKNLLDFEDERETTTKSNKIMYDSKYIDYIIMSKKNKNDKNDKKKKIEDDENEKEYGNLNEKEIKFNFKEIYDDRTFAEDFHKTDYLKNVNITTKLASDLD